MAKKNIVDQIIQEVAVENNVSEKIVRSVYEAQFDNAKELLIEGNDVIKLDYIGKFKLTDRK